MSDGLDCVSLMCDAKGYNSLIFEAFFMVKEDVRPLGPKPTILKLSVFVWAVLAATFVGMLVSFGGETIKVTEIFQTEQGGDWLDVRTGHEVYRTVRRAQRHGKSGRR